MDLKNLFKDDDAVSPVIGVILMVAITVILAAVIGAFVLNIGGSQEAAPQATLQWETTGDPTTGSGTVTITHQSGEAIPAGEVTIKTDPSSLSTSKWSNKLTAGDSETLTNSASTNDKISIVWNSPSSDKSSIIASYMV